MESSKSLSFFQDIRSREVNGFRVRKRPYPDNDLSKFTQTGAVVVEHNGNHRPPMALSFCKTSKNSHIIVVTDEDGYISLFNTRLKFSSSSTFQENSEKARVNEWVAHENAIFDVCWIKGSDTRINYDNVVFTVCPNLYDNAVYTALHGKEVVVECKFDGDRIQIHKNGKDIQFFSRNFLDHPEYAHSMLDVIMQNILVDSGDTDAVVPMIK
ncbi:unnamed protein product [Camellia sinensis]